MGRPRCGAYRAAVAALPADTRRIFLLHRVDGLDIVTIAWIMGVPTCLVEERLADAVLSISTTLDAEPT
jgi:DNA-directed RNA polymerase specialized sigma24 family protein